MNRLSNKVIAIAGGAGGIGTALSQRYAEEGAAVLVGDINLEAATAVAATITDLGGRASAERVDIGDDDSVRHFVARCSDLYGGLDGFHANAAYSHPDDLDAVDTPLPAYRDVMRVDAEGFFICTRHAIPALLERGGGAMLYTSSGAAHKPFPVRVTYGMAKAAGHALVRHVALRWGKDGVRANAIAPGIVMHHELEQAAPQLRHEGMESSLLPRVGEPDDIAAMSALLMSDEGKFVTGQIISIDGGGTLRP